MTRHDNKLGNRPLPFLRATVSPRVNDKSMDRLPGAAKDHLMNKRARVAHSQALREPVRYVGTRSPSNSVYMPGNKAITTKKFRRKPT